MDFLRRPLPYRAEYSASDRSKCKSCKSSIERKSLRMAFKKKSANGYQTTGWYHPKCFFDYLSSDNKANDLKIENMEHFAHLRYSDQQFIRKEFNQLMNSMNGNEVLQNHNGMNEDFNQIESESVRRALESETNQLKLLEEQSNQLYHYFDNLEKMAVPDIKTLLKENGIRAAKKKFSKFYSLADAMTFGVLEKCPNCMNGQLVFRVCGYICSRGALAEFADCTYHTTEQPKRKQFLIPEELKDEYGFLKEYEFKEWDRQYIPELLMASENFILKNQSPNGNQSMLNNQIKNFIEEFESDREDSQILETKGRDGSDSIEQLEGMTYFQSKRGLNIIYSSIQIQIQ